MRIEVALYGPCTRCVVPLILFRLGAEHASRLNDRMGGIHGRIEMVDADKLNQVLGAHVFPLLAERIREVKGVHAQLIRHDGIAVIRDFSCDPVMAADGFHPPDFAGILKGDAVHLIGAEGFEQMPETEDTFPGGMDVREHQCDHVLFADAARRFREPVMGRLIDHQRVAAEYPAVAGNGFGGRHAHVFSIDTGRSPDSAVRQSIGHASVAERLFRKLHSEMGKDGVINPGLLRRQYHGEFFGDELT